MSDSYSIRLCIELQNVTPGQNNIAPRIRSRCDEAKYSWLFLLFQLRRLYNSYTDPLKNANGCRSYVIFPWVYKRSIFVKLYVTVMYQCVYCNLISIMLRIVYLAEPPYGIIYVYWYRSPACDTYAIILYPMFWNRQSYSVSTQAQQPSSLPSVTSFPRVAGTAVTSFPAKCLNCHISRTRHTRIPLFAPNWALVSPIQYTKNQAISYKGTLRIWPVFVTLWSGRSRAGKKVTAVTFYPLSHRESTCVLGPPGSLIFLHRQTSLSADILHKFVCKFHEIENNYTPATKLFGAYTGFTPSVRPSRIPYPLCNIYSYEWILFILGKNDHYYKRVCRTPWPLTLTYIFKVIWPWLRKSCPLCSVYSSGWILIIFGTNDHYQ